VRVPFFRSPWQDAHNGARAVAHFSNILAQGKYILGNEVSKFEKDFSRYLGRAIVGVNSGTDALYLAMKVLGVGPGDEVILTTYTFHGCLEAVMRVGAQPVLIDTATSGGYMPDLAQMEAAVTPKTKAILYVGLFGDLGPLGATVEFCRNRGLLLIEDAAQSCGAILTLADGCKLPAGAIGDAAAFSFYPTKNFGAAGDAGAVSFRTQAAAERCRLLRNHARNQGLHVAIGLNSRLDELQAALLNLLLPEFEARINRRRNIARCYLECLKTNSVIVPPANTQGHSWNYFVCRHPRRDEFVKRLAAAGVETRIYYASALHKQPSWRELFSELNFPNSEKLGTEVCALPIYPDLTDQEVEIVCEALSQRW
jgi:dTDP-4-amino-4,6-dideoxygalactose transaminase